jgi:hypothetical protein
MISSVVESASAAGVQTSVLARTTLGGKAGGNCTEGRTGNDRNGRRWSATTGSASGVEKLILNRNRRQGNLSQFIIKNLFVSSTRN